MSESLEHANVEDDDSFMTSKVQTSFSFTLTHKLSYPSWDLFCPSAALLVSSR